ATMEPNEWRRIVATNLDSVFHMCRLVVPHMRERRFGRIVNLAAVGAAWTQGEPQMTAYGGDKAKAKADELLGDRVPVGHPGCAADVVRAVLFFCSPAADFVTGQVVEVAGGALL